MQVNCRAVAALRRADPRGSPVEALARVGPDNTPLPVSALPGPGGRCRAPVCS